MTAAYEAMLLCQRYFPWRLKPEPEEIVPKNEQADDLSSEHGVKGYEGGGYELPRHEQAIVGEEN